MNKDNFLIDNNGNKYHLLDNGTLSSIKEDNSLVNNNGICSYNGKLIHRENGPAIEYANGTKKWFINGLKHRIDGPAVEWACGDKDWYLNGLKHRVGLPACIEEEGTKKWYQDGKRHREDGPAIEYEDGTKEYWLNGKILSEIKYKEYLIEKEHNQFKSEINNNNIKTQKVKI